MNLLNRRNPLRFSLVSALIAMALAVEGCAPSGDDESAESSENELQAIGPDAIVGTIALGENVIVTHTDELLVAAAHPGAPRLRRRRL